MLVSARWGDGAWPRPPSFRFQRDPGSAALAAALAGGDVEVSAGEWRPPVGDQVLRALEEVGPLVAHDQAGGLPHHVELAVGLDLADQHRLGDVVVRHHGGDAAGEVRHLDAVHGDVHLGGSIRRENERDSGDLRADRGDLLAADAVQAAEGRG